MRQAHEALFSLRYYPALIKPMSAITPIPSYGASKTPYVDADLRQANDAFLRQANIMGDPLPFPRAAFLDLQVAGLDPVAHLTGRNGYRPLVPLGLGRGPTKPQWGGFPRHQRVAIH